MTFLRAGLWILLLVLTGRSMERLKRSHLPATIETPTRNGTTFLSRTDDFADAQQEKAPSRKRGMLTRAKGTHEAWPDAATLALPAPPSIAIVEENASLKRWTYRSKNFDFISNAPLHPKVLQEFVGLLELTHLYCRQLPFALTRLHGFQEGELQVHLIEDTAHYLARGGSLNSNGVYLSDADVILIPFEGLGLKSHQGRYTLDELRTNQTLVHEATHMLMRGPLLQYGWFVEGAAEYVATIPHSDQSLFLDQHLKAIKSYVTEYGHRNRGGHNLGNKLRFPSLEILMDADYQSFQSIPNAYPYSLLLFHYFAHSDGEGDAQNLRNYVQALHEGAENNTARELLLAGRSYRTIEKLLTNSWKKNGIAITFHN